MKNTLSLVVVALLCSICINLSQAALHPGCLSTQADLDRMREKVAAGEQPWKGSWDILVSNTNYFLDDSPLAVSTVCVGSGCSDNYMNLARDAAKAYQCALRYQGSANIACANKAVEIMNAWASTHTAWDGDSNIDLRSGLYGYQFACAAELMRDYSGWNSSDFSAFKQYMLDVFYPENSDFLIRLNGTYEFHYWANWTLASAASMMAIGVLCDDEAIFDEGLNAIYNHRGTARMEHAVPIIHPNGLGQWQESGRDQGHSLIGPQLMGTICEIAWNQGVDLYGYLNNRFLASVEYISKYNTWQDVPYTTYIRKYGNMEYGAVYDVMESINSSSRGQIRPGWDLIYNHYVNRMGMSAQFTEDYAKLSRPEGGGFNYGSTSGGFDGLGFTTLTHSRDPIASGATPSALLPYIEGRKITLSWAGSAYATSYNIKRSTNNGGPYATLATVQDTYYVDLGLTAGTTYYYVISANNPDGESANSDQAVATANRQLTGTIIGTDGSWNDGGATKKCVFDGSLQNYFDAPTSVAWAGLDLGEGVKAVITQIKYCPREAMPSRMVGGKFQGSNTADFSSEVTTLFTITSAPSVEVFTSQNISSANSFRYLRYLCPSGGYGNVAEVQFLGNVSGLNAAPFFTTNPINNVDGIELTDYEGESLGNYTYDADGDELTYRKDSGADWLNVALDGVLSGIPDDSDTGINVFTVCVTDSNALFDTVIMNINVANTYSGIRGLEDLSGMMAQWMLLNCSDIPACDGADLDGDADVDLSDFAELASNWEIGI